jgi:cytosine/uracil/thiamine/allantoin permease
LLSKAISAQAETRGQKTDHNVAGFFALCGVSIHATMRFGSDQSLINPSGAVMNRCRNVGRATRLASCLVLLTTAALSVAANAAPPSTQAAEAMHMNMSPAERAALIAEATANATTLGAMRMATPAERAEMAIPPGRRNAENASSEQKNAPKRREMRSGNTVGLVVGTELMSHRSVTVTADGKHLETCGSAAHTHDEKTTALISRANKAGKTGKAGAIRE